MFHVIQREGKNGNYLALVLKETAEHLYVTSPELSKVSKKVQSDGALAGLTQKQLALLSGRGFARLNKSQEYDVEDSFEDFAEGVSFISGETHTAANDNPIKMHIINKFMTEKNVGALASLDEGLTSFNTAMSAIAVFCTSLSQKVSTLNAELNNRATARDVKGIQTVQGKIEAVLSAIKANATTNTLLEVGNTLAGVGEIFDANEFLGLETVPEGKTSAKKAA